MRDGAELFANGLGDWHATGTIQATLTGWQATLRRGSYRSYGSLTRSIVSDHKFLNQKYLDSIVLHEEF